MKKLVMIAGGGTGGHIYPAIAVGRALAKVSSDVEVRFVGTAEGLESKILNRENLPLHLISSGKLNFSGGTVKKIKTLLKIPIGLFQSLVLILRYRPQFVLGVGGYASAPFLLMAALLGKKTALWEPNAHPGLANRILSWFVPQAYLAFAEAKKFLHSTRIQVIGMPLREEIDLAADQKILPTTDKLTILCFGGSQGSLFINKVVSDFVLTHPELHDQIRVIHQTGALGYSEMKNKYQSILCVELHEYIYDMPSVYRQAHLQVCRGGASTLAEAAAFGVVPLIIPLPAADNHQHRNAEVIVKANAGFLFEQESFNSLEFSKVILKLRDDQSFRKMLSENLKKLAPRHAAALMAKDIYENQMK